MISETHSHSVENDYPFYVMPNGKEIRLDWIKEVRAKVTLPPFHEAYYVAVYFLNGEVEYLCRIELPHIQEVPDSIWNRGGRQLSDALKTAESYNEKQRVEFAEKMKVQNDFCKDLADTHKAFIKWQFKQRGGVLPLPASPIPQAIEKMADTLAEAIENSGSMQASATIIGTKTITDVIGKKLEDMAGQMHMYAYGY